MELIGGASLLQRVLSRLATVSTEIILVVAQGQAKPLHALPPETRVIEDIFPDAGSLGGIYSGLMASSSCNNLIVACDMPFLNVSLLRYLLELPPSYDAVIPRVGGYLEPLHAVYSKDCLPSIRQLLKQDNHKIIDFLPQIKVRYVEEEEVNRFDPEHLSFLNINTQENLDRARRLVLSGTPLLAAPGNMIEAKRGVHRR